MAETTTVSAEQERQFQEAIAVANIPTLLMVLTQLTGETHWLEAPYKPGRQTGMGDNDSGGLTEDHQREVREAALEAILAWKAGRPVALPEPPEEMLVRMLSVAMSEHVPDEYGAFTAAQLGQTKFLDHEPFNVPEGYKVIIIGAGVSGLCAGINLQMANVPFEILERHPTVGGVWWENKYPGAGVDTPNHLYSFSFASYDWKNYFCLRDELFGYLEHVADQFDMRRHVSFDTTVTDIHYDENSQTWTVNTRDKQGNTESRVANVVISAAGLFNPPIEPNIEGLDTWQGEKWHTARWPDNASVKDKRVAIIGNGASCMQTAPEIQNDVESLTIFQRSNCTGPPRSRQFRKQVPGVHCGSSSTSVELYRNVVSGPARMDLQRPDPLSPCSQGSELGPIPTVLSTPRTMPTAPSSPTT